MNDFDVTYPFLYVPASKVNFNFIWSTAGSKAKYEASFWQPVPPEGFASLGTFIKRSLGRPDDSDGAIVFVLKDSDFAKPCTSMKDMIWTSKGIKSNYNADMYIATAPDNYQCLGIYMHKGNSPVSIEELENIYCINKNYIIQSSTLEDPLWNDNKISGSDRVTVKLYKAAPGITMKGERGETIGTLPYSILKCCTNEDSSCSKYPKGLCDDFMVRKYCKRFKESDVCACINRPVSKKSGKQLHPHLAEGCTGNAYVTRTINALLQSDLNVTDCSITSDIISQGSENKINQVTFENNCGIKKSEKSSSSSSSSSILSSLNSKRSTVIIAGGSIAFLIIVIIMIIIIIK